MRHEGWITIVAMTLALAGGRGLASAGPGHHYRHTRGHSHAYARHALRRHAPIVGDRRTHMYRVLAYRSQWPPPRDRVYFGTTAQARAAGYRQTGQGPIPIPPWLTWRGARNQLPSLGKHRVAPQSPQDMQKPVVPPKADQPPVTPTNPMPN